MRVIASTLLSFSLVLGLTACDKAGDAKKAGAKKADTKKDADAKKAEPKPADDKPADDKPADDKPADDFVDDTKGLAAALRAAAGDSTAPASTEGAPSYDTTKDAGGLIGHLASGLSHDEALAESKTAKELVRLGGEKDKSASDNQLCGHVWDNIRPKAFAELGDDKKDGFVHDCKVEIEKERVKLGVEIFAQHSACVLAAPDLAALDLCDAAEQAAEDDLHQNPHGDSPDNKLCVAAVEHMFMLINRDMVEDPDLLEILQEDIDGIKEDGLLACRDEGTKAELQCVMKAAVLADLEKCTKPAE